MKPHLGKISNGIGEEPVSILYARTADDFNGMVQWTVKVPISFWLVSLKNWMGLYSASSVTSPRSEHLTKLEPTSIAG